MTAPTAEWLAGWNAAKEMARVKIAAIPCWGSMGHAPTQKLCLDALATIVPPSVSGAGHGREHEHG